MAKSKSSKNGRRRPVRRTSSSSSSSSSSSAGVGPVAIPPQLPAALVRVFDALREYFATHQAAAGAPVLAALEQLDAIARDAIAREG